MHQGTQDRTKTEGPRVAAVIPPGIRREPIDRPTLLRLAAEADCDPRSIIRELAAFRGERAHVTGRAGERVRAVLSAHGLIPQGDDV